MIAKKPTQKEEKFLRGANGASDAGIFRPRLPEDLCARLKEMAWKRRITANALIVELLESAIKNMKGR